MERRACSIYHDHVLRTLGAQRVSDTGRNYDSDIVAAATIVAVDVKAHRARGQSFSYIPQNHLKPPLHEKHHVPLFSIVTAQRIVRGFVQKQAAMPFCRSRVRWNAWWMHMKPFCTMGKHPRRRPLLWP